jgi:hypothetical protein
VNLAWTDSKRLRGALGLASVLLLVVGGLTVYLRRPPTATTVDDALAAYRASTAASASASIPTSAPSTADGAAATAGPTPPADAPGTTPTPTPTTSATTSPAAEQPRTAAATPQRASADAAPESASSPPATARPSGIGAIADGVYTYATEGYEETNALGGARHDYPAETPVTVGRAPCGGITFRWQPLSERWDQSLLCPEAEDAVAVRSYTTYHEFFGRSQQQEFTCPEGTHVHRRGAAAGATWQWRCTAGASSIDTTVTVVGVEALTIGDRTIQAVHVHYASTLQGGNRGTQDQHRWLDPDTGMNLRIRTNIDTEADSPFGAVHYVERYTTTLTSMEPKR